jgi:hypothetical protein
MGDLRNKFRKDQEAEQTRRIQARYAVPKGKPFSPVCDGCGLKGINNPSPKGYGFLRFYAVSGEWQQPGKFYCEFCLERLTGEKPHGE